MWSVAISREKNRVIAAICGATILVSGCGSSPADAPVDGATSLATPPAITASEPASDPAKVQAFSDAIRKEPKVVDLVHDGAAVVHWTVGVKDDGSPRFGFAEYLCGLLKDHGLPAHGEKVRIVDYKNFMLPGGNARDASLGAVDCETYEHIMP